jgi:hypothetical protein
MIQGMNQFPQPGHPEMVVPGEERPGRSLVGGLPRTHVHRITIDTIMLFRAVERLAGKTW